MVVGAKTGKDIPKNIVTDGPVVTKANAHSIALDGGAIPDLKPAGSLIKGSRRCPHVAARSHRRYVMSNLAIAACLAPIGVDVELASSADVVGSRCPRPLGLFRETHS
jgi:hypothetical protein